MKKETVLRKYEKLNNSHDYGRATLINNPSFRVILYPSFEPQFFHPR